MNEESKKVDLTKYTENHIDKNLPNSLDIYEKKHDENPPKKPSKKGIVGFLLLIGTFLFKLKVPLLIVLSKFKFIFAALKFSKFFTMFFSMFVTIFIYAKLYGFAFGIGFVILILIHELGHFLTAKYLNLDVSAPVFIPFIGALIAMKEAPKDSITETKVAFGGPILGSLASIICFYIGITFNSGLFLSLALVGFILNIFNLIPIHPMDGGRIVTSISPKLWFIGIPILLILMIVFFSPIMLLIIILGIKQIINYFKIKDKNYYNVPVKLRNTFGLLYFSSIAILGFFIVYITQLLDSIAI
ncbi:MAG: site-2 protease family protein [Clostridiales bacterium]